MLLLCALVAGSGSVWADTETFAYGDYKGKGTSSSGSSYTMVKTDVSIGSDKFYGNNSYAHFYAGGTTTITPGTGVTITSIELTASATGYNGYQSSGTVTASTGSVSGSTSSTKVTWTGSATAAFTISNSKQIRWTSIVVTYTKSAGSSPSISLGTSSASPTCAAGDGTINVTYNNIASVDAEVKFYESDGTTPATYTWIDAEINGDNNLYYTYDANAGAARKAYLKVHEKNNDVYSGLITITQDAYSVAAPSFSIEGGSYIEGYTFTITSAGNTIYYTTDGTTPTASSTQYAGPIAIPAGKTTYKAIAIDANDISSSVVTRTITGITPATLPFSWAGGAKTAFTALTGVVQTGIDSDYADDTYKLKFNTTGDNFIIFTDGKPVKVTIGVKMAGGASSSKFTVQESTNGATFTDVEELTISGSKDDIVNLETTASFAATTRVVKFVFTKGDNVGVGPITISADPVPVTISAAEYATYCNATKALDFSTTGITVYTATDNETYVTLNEVATGKVPANTPVVLYKAGADGSAIDVPVIASADAIAGTNDLHVSTGKDVENMYVLAKNPTIGFYPWAGTIDLSAGKIYLQGNASYSAREFIGFDFGFGGETTGINAVNGSRFTVNGSQVYNLNGQRIANPKKGLYIVNGKKVAIK